MLVIMISVMLNLKYYAENHGKKIEIIFVLINPKREIKEDIDFSMKSKTHIYIVLLRQKLFDYHKCCIHLKTEKIWKTSRS